MRRRVTKALLATLGAGLLAWLLYQTGWEALIVARRLGVTGSVAILALFAVAQIPACLAWRALLPPSSRVVPLRQLYAAYAAGDALNLSVPSADLAGDVAKTFMLKRALPWEHAAASVTLFRLVELIAVAALLALGMLVAWMRLSLPLWWHGVGVAIVAGMVVASATVLGLGRGGLYGRALRWLPLRFRRVPEAGQAIDAAMNAVLSQPLAVPLAGILVFASWAAGAVEAYLVLHWLHASASWESALAIESFGVVIATATSFVPGRLGVGDGGRVLLLSGLGIPLSIATAFAVIRRLREVCWFVVGWLCLVAHHRGRSPIGTQPRSNASWWPDSVGWGR